jgi:hypothetical protein
VFSGDVYFHSVDHDLSKEADRIDTSRCAVFLLTGEYDGPTLPLTLEAAERNRAPAVR